MATSDPRVSLQLRRAHLWLITRRPRPALSHVVAAVPDDTEGMQASELLSRTEEFRATLCEARARGLSPDEQEDLDELIRAMRRLVDEPHSNQKPIHQVRHRCRSA